MKKLLLNIERIDAVAEAYVASLDGVSFELKYLSKKPYIKKQYILQKGGERAFLNCHISKGRVSFDIQGVNDELREICKECTELLVSELTIPQPDRKCLKVVEVSEAAFNDLLNDIRKEAGIIVEDKQITNSTLRTCCTIMDTYGAEVSVQYFNNGTVYVQGAISTLFVWLQTFLVSFLSPVPDSVKDEFLNISSVEEDVFSQDLSHYFHHPEHFTGSVIETLIKTSFVIANSAVILPDYGAMTYGIFKALEALLYKRIRMDRPSQNDFSCFKYDKATKMGSWQVSTYDGHPALKRALLCGYEFYCSNRHTTFHVDPTLVTTRLLSKEEAIGLITDTIDKINDICDNW